ncbi:MAG: PEGA domain-containing protein [Polyangiales bacterium]
MNERRTSAHDRFARRLATPEATSATTLRLLRSAPLSVAVACALVIANLTGSAEGQVRARPRANSIDASVSDGSLDAAPSVDAAAALDAAIDGDDHELRRERASAEFGLGMNDYRRGDFASAAAHFQAAYESLPDPAPLFNMARSWEGANEITRALDAYQRYLAAAPDASDRDEVLARIALLRQRPVEVFVSSQPPGAFVFVDGSSEPIPGTTPLVLRLQPGRHTVALVREGYSRHERAVDVRAGERQTVAIPLTADDPASANNNGRFQDPVILDRRVAVPWATRFALLLGAARTLEGQPFFFSFGGDFTLFYRRNFMANARLLRIEPDGAWTVGTVGAGYVLPIEDIDLALVGHLGAAYGFHNPSMLTPRQWNAAVGIEGRVDWYFHRRLSLGVFVRGDLLTDFSPVLRFQSNLGVALGLTP